MCLCVAAPPADRRPAECGLAGSLVACVCVFLIVAMPSAVWPAGLVRVLRLLPDQRPAECSVAGRVGRLCSCVAAPP